MKDLQVRDQIIGTATKIKDRKTSNPQADQQSFYKLEPAYLRMDYETQETTHEVNYVWVSAAIIPYGGPETYIFESDENGEVLDWSEMEGSYKGGFSHSEALARLGYAIMK